MSNKFKDTALNITNKVLDPIEEHLRKKFNINNILEYDFETLDNKSISDYDISNVRGSVQIIEGHIMTVQESEAMLDHALNLDFSQPKKLK